MDRKLVWTEKASGDIEAIVRYIARRDPSAAARIGLGIYDRAQILLQHPEAGTILDELREDRMAETHFPTMEGCLHNPWGRHHYRQSLASSDGRGRFGNTALNLPVNSQLLLAPARK